MKPTRLLSAALLGVALIGGPAAFADAVTDWNTAFEASLTGPGERGPGVPFRTWAIMHGAMFDAVNGIEHKYQPWIVTDSAPNGANAEAAAIQAAYTVASALLPAHQAAFDAQLAASLATLPSSPHETKPIARGRAWGTTVANAILAARATDGYFTVLPPFVSPTTAGYWRHAPLGAAPNAGYNFTVTQPMLIPSAAAFDPGPPYGFANRADALTSASYTADVIEIKARGGKVSAVRTDAEADDAFFINAMDVASLNHALREHLPAHTKLVDNARTFAMFNMTVFDAAVVAFTHKYKYAFWRPFQAINFGDEDNNPATDKDATWVPLGAPTPPHPEYPSAHVTLFTSLVHVAARLVGDNSDVEVSAPGYAAPRTYDSWEAISDASANARVNFGYHFRETTEISQLLGRHIADYNYTHAMRPVHGKCDSHDH